MSPRSFRPLTLLLSSNKQLKTLLSDNVRTYILGQDFCRLFHVKIKSMSFRLILYLLISTSTLLAQNPGLGLAQPPAASAPAPDTPAVSGESSHPNDQTETVIHAIVNEVNLVFTVTDKHRRFVKNLGTNDIKLLDDNKPPAKVTDFRSETDLPLRVGLLIDVSGSVRSRFSFEQQAAIEFLTRVVRKDKDLAFITGFDTTP